MPHFEGDDYAYSYHDVLAAPRWAETARITNAKRARSWRVTAHEPRWTAGMGAFGIGTPAWEPSVPVPPTAGPGRIVDVDAGLLLRTQWQRMGVDFAVVQDYVRGRSFTVHAGDVDVAVFGRLTAASVDVQVLCGATIEPAQQGAMSAWPPTRSKHSGTIDKVTAGVTDYVFIRIPPHARAFRWHQTDGVIAAGGLWTPTTITVTQEDSPAVPGDLRGAFTTLSSPASWPNATGAVPIGGTAAFLSIANNDATHSVGFWIEFLLDLGG